MAWALPRPNSCRTPIRMIGSSDPSAYGLSSQRIHMIPEIAIGKIRSFQALRLSLA
jgi:hypothetical protein